MEVEHLATLERLRQSQRQDYLKVSPCDVKPNMTYITTSFLFVMFLNFRDRYQDQCRRQIA